MAHLSQYTLTPAEARALRLTDTYSLHRVVYDLFEDVRGGNTEESSGILFADKGGDARSRRLLILSDRPPRPARVGRLETKSLPPEYLQADVYRFATVANPARRESASGKIVPVRGREAVAAWFRGKAPGWGFAVAEPWPQVDALTVDRFTKGGHDVTLGKATLTGVLSVTNRDLFIQSVTRGIGRGRAFGCGLLQIIPLA